MRSLLQSLPRCRRPMTRAAASSAMRGSQVTIKTPADQEQMRVAGRLAAEVLDMIGPHVRAGRHAPRSSTGSATTTS